METSKSFKKAMVLSVVSAASSVLIAFAARRLATYLLARHQLAHTDKNLNTALVDSMDCSDAVAKY
jgi:hypothetical protein